MDVNEAFDLAAKELEQAVFGGLSDTEELKACVFDILPIEPRDVKTLSVKGTISRFKAELCCSLSSNANIEEFVSAYSRQTVETLNIAASKRVGKKSKYEQYKVFRCHHNTRYAGTRHTQQILERNPAKRFKNTNCPFKMVVKKLKECTDYPFLIYLEWNHNHSVNSLQAWTFRDIPSTLYEKVKGMIEQGLTPALAYRTYMQELREKCKDDIEFHMLKSDRSNCPRRDDFYNIYTEYCKLNFGGKNGIEMLAALDDRVLQLKEFYPDLSIQRRDYDKEKGTPFILAIITPLMKRVHLMVGIPQYY